MSNDILFVLFNDSIIIVSSNDLIIIESIIKLSLLISYI